MADTVISVRGLAKQYRLGVIGATTLQEDLRRGWARLRGKPDPTLRIGQQRVSSDQQYAWALRNISFDVTRGEILGIVGRNGAGKSTLLKVLTRITAPTLGEVGMRGRVGALLEVGTGFHPELTGRENVHLSGAILGMSREEVREQEEAIIAFSGCGAYIDTPIKRYSSGMKVRLGFAVAAHLQPEILLIDEVLAVGDAEFQKKCLGKMEDVASQGRTVLFVSHNMNAVKNLCQRCVLLTDGMVERDGDASEVVDHYLSGSVSTNTKRTPSATKVAWIEEVTILDAQSGAPVDYVETGQSIRLRIRYNSNGTLETLGFGIILKDVASGLRLFATLSSRRDKCRAKPSRSGIAELQITQFPLLPGFYSITATLNAPSFEYDRAVDVRVFQVASADSEETEDAVSRSRNGVVWIDSDWKLDGEEPTDALP